MSKHLIIICIAISTFVAAGIYGCKDKPELVDKPAAKIVSKKISNESSSKASDKISNEKKSNTAPTIAGNNITEKDISNKEIEKSNEGKPEIHVSASDQPIEIQDQSDPTLATDDYKIVVQEIKSMEEKESTERNEELDERSNPSDNINENLEKRQAAEVLAILHKEGGVGSVYNESTLDSLRSPFLPLFKPEPPKNEDERENKTNKRTPASPIEQVDLSQLKLVATLRAKSGNKALVEDSTGKGYVIEKGSFIGMNQGSVVEITDEKVIVEEELETMTGKVKIQRREMKLQKAPGE